MAAAVLRVKRKRGVEAAEALLLACKRPRAAGEPAPELQVVRTLFRLAATVGSQDDTVQQHIKEAISKDKALLALKPSGASAQRVHLGVRASRQAARQEGRYKVIASHRRNCSKSLNDEKTDQESDSNTSEAQAQEEGGSQKINGTASTSGKDDIGSAEEIEVFDVVQHEEDKGDSKNKRCTDFGPGEDDPETIVCNSVKMIREKLTVSDCGLGAEHRENMEEYVYDIYYTDGYISGGGIQDILSVVPYYEEHELMKHMRMKMMRMKKTIGGMIIQMRMTGIVKRTWTKKMDTSPVKKRIHLISDIVSRTLSRWTLDQNRGHFCKCLFF